jgi:hypothetical protein
MDAVRFGRALGFGARQAAKTVISAVDAARAESPSGPATAAPSAGTPAPPATRTAATPRAASAAASSALAPRRAAVSTVASSAARPAPQIARSIPQPTTRGSAQARGIRAGFGRFRESAVEPAVRLSGVLWLEVTGVFFGIFALSTAIAVWRLRSQWRAALMHPATHGGLLVGVAVFALFAYFCITSFIRARRRERRRG